MCAGNSENTKTDYFYKYPYCAKFIVFWEKVQTDETLWQNYFVGFSIKFEISHKKLQKVVISINVTVKLWLKYITGQKSQYT